MTERHTPPRHATQLAMWVSGRLIKQTDRQTDRRAVMMPDLFFPHSSRRTPGRCQPTGKETGPEGRASGMMPAIHMTSCSSVKHARLSVLQLPFPQCRGKRDIWRSDKQTDRQTDRQTDSSLRSHLITYLTLPCFTCPCQQRSVAVRRLSSICPCVSTISGRQDKTRHDKTGQGRGDVQQPSRRHGSVVCRPAVRPRCRAALPFLYPRSGMIGVFVVGVCMSACLYVGARVLS
ncbi:hypothetical protein IWX47DRAFT_58686 [Phyllosticta citricarpa]